MAASNEAIGVGESRYAGKEHAPFACHNCVHYAWPHLCNHPLVIKDAQANKHNASGFPRMQKNGSAVIEPGGCCNYFR